MSESLSDQENFEARKVLADIEKFGFSKPIFRESEGLYTVHYLQNEIDTEIDFYLFDEEFSVDLLIFGIISKPKEHGNGSKAIQNLIAWAESHDLQKIGALTVVNPGAKIFWRKMGFSPSEDKNKKDVWAYNREVNQKD